MAATKLQKGWTEVQFADTAISHVQSVAFGRNGSLIEYTGDNNIEPIMIAIKEAKPHATVTSGDVATIMGFQVGDTGSLVAVQPDAKGSTGGNINWTLANAVVASADSQGHWGAFATATLKVQAYSSDGTTSALSFTLT